MIDNFEPFDLARAEAGEEVQFRKSDKLVRFVGVLYDDKGKVRSIVLASKDHADSCEREFTRRPDGILYRNYENYSHDIVMKPKPPVVKTFWACFDISEDGNPLHGVIKTKAPELNYQHVIPIEVTLPQK